MKKIYLSFYALFASSICPAQLHLSGTSYSQHFDSLAYGLPPGWYISTSATATSTGISSSTPLTSIPGSSTSWANASGAFKNVASANAFSTYATTTTSLQTAATDRALGIKQTAKFGDPGAAFMVQLDHTYGLEDFELSFQLQSLDSSGGSRISSWAVEYAIGSSPSSFYSVSGASLLTTGGNTFSNKTIHVSFGSLLNNQALPVWIRIVSLNNSTGAGSRTTTAIDDFNLSWKGMAFPEKPVITELIPANSTIGLPLTVVPSIRFNRQITKGTTGSYYVKNETDNTTQTIAATDTAVHIDATGTEIVLNNVALSFGKSYHITFDSTVVDSVGFTPYGIYDTTAWAFSTINAIPASLYQSFDSSCTAGLLIPYGWTKHNISGTGQEWNCYTSIGSAISYGINAYDAGSYYTNEDWLISPPLNMGSMAGTTLVFNLFKRSKGIEPEVLISENYSGYGNPAAATWTSLGISMSAADTNKWKVYTAPLGSASGLPLYIAFRYLSTATSGYAIQVDNIHTVAPANIHESSVLPQVLTIVGQASGNDVNFLFQPESEDSYTVLLYDINGYELSRSSIHALAGMKQLFSIRDLSLAPGLYLLKVDNHYSSTCVKVIIP